MSEVNVQASQAGFDPVEVAHLETEGWRGYYEHRWLRVFGLLVRLNRRQFGMPLPWAVVGAIRIARASAAWAPEEHDEAKVARLIEGYYRVAHRFGQIRCAPRRAADLELRYWEVHRRLINQEDKSGFVDAMTDLHREVFGVSDPVARASAVERVEANNAVDRITQGWSTDIAEDWREVETHLRNCYELVARPSAGSSRSRGRCGLS